jgi:hypothetical protein
VLQHDLNQNAVANARGGQIEQPWNRSRTTPTQITPIVTNKTASPASQSGS